MGPRLPIDPIYNKFECARQKTDETSNKTLQVMTSEKNCYPQLEKKIGASQAHDRFVATSATQRING